MPGDLTQLPLVDIAYVAIAVATTATMTALLWAIGRAASACPVSGRAVRGVALAVIGAYACITLGLIALIGALGVETDLGDARRLFAQIGAAALAAGVGFSIAAATLRDAVERLAPPVRPDASPTEPVSAAQ